MPLTVNTGLNDAQSHNESARSTHIYKDLNLYFTKHPFTADVSKVTDVQAIKRSVRNLVLTNKGERLFHPEIGGNVRQSLFQNFTPISVIELQSAITDVIRTYEPRVILEEVVVNEATALDLDANRLRIIVQFSLANEPNTIEEVEVFLDRIR